MERLFRQYEVNLEEKMKNRKKVEKDGVRQAFDDYLRVVTPDAESWQSPFSWLATSAVLSYRSRVSSSNTNQRRKWKYCH